MFSKRFSFPLWHHLRTYGRNRSMLHPRVACVSSLPTVSVIATVIPTRKPRSARSMSQNVSDPGKVVGSIRGNNSTRTSLIQTATLPELEIISGDGVESLHEISVILERLGQLNKEDKFDIASLTSNKKLQVLESLLHNNVTHLSPSVLVSCLRSLMDMSPTDTYLIRSLEQQVLWLLRKMPVGILVKIIEVHETHLETQLRQQIYNDAVATLSKRWVEISKPKDLVTLMYLFLEKDGDFFAKLEDRALDVAEHMQPKDLYQVLYLLSRRSSRNTPLIRAMTYHLNKSQVPLQLKHLMNLMFACSRLGIYDVHLLDSISSAARKQMPKAESPSIVCSLLTSAAVLRWRNRDLINALLKFIENNLKNLSSKEKAGVVVSLAKLNFCTSGTLELVSKIATGDLGSLRLESPPLWLDLVWSLAVHGALTANMAESVLEPKFVEKILVGSDFQDFQIQLRKTKLVNVQTAAQLEVPDYNGAVLTRTSITDETQMLQKPDRKLSALVIAALTTVAPSDKYVKTGVVTSSGYFMDAELFVDKKGDPIVYKDAVDKPDLHRLCIKVLDFSDLTLSSVEMTGLHAMSSRHLTKLGYTVIELPYEDLANKTSVVKRVTYLQSKIKAAVEMKGR